MSRRTQEPGAYPLARGVLSADIDGAKRKRVLAVVAAFLDEGIQPSLDQIATRAKLPRGTKGLWFLLRRLETDGLLRISRSKPPAPDHYEIVLSALDAGSRQ